jgi:hypothetical protein
MLWFWVTGVTLVLQLSPTLIQTFKHINFSYGWTLKNQNIFTECVFLLISRSPD